MIRAHDYTTRDSGVRAEFKSGMVRDTEAGKARFDLLLPLEVPYQMQMLTRFADLMARGAEKYDARNWEKARSADELERYRSSALRHLVQWATGETDEDHAAGVMFNLMAGETVRYKMGEDEAATGDRPLRCSSSGNCYLGESHQCQKMTGHLGNHWAQGETCIPIGMGWLDEPKTIGEAVQAGIDGRIMVVHSGVGSSPW
jgi:hypothetical protein